MKFRALNLDYHGEATLEWAEKEIAERSKNKSLSTALICIGCYERTQGTKNTPTKPLTSNLDSFELVEMIAHESDLQFLVKATHSNIPTTTAYSVVEVSKFMDNMKFKLCADTEKCMDVPQSTATRLDENGFSCTSPAPDKRLLVAVPPRTHTAEIKSKHDSEMQISMDMFKIVATNADEKPIDRTEAVEEEVPIAMLLQSHAKTNYVQPLLSPFALKIFFDLLNNRSQTVRLANETWHDRVPQYFQACPFWREARRYLPARCANENACALFQHCKSLSLNRASKRIKAVAIGLGPQIQLFVGHSVLNAPYSFSFNLLEMLRGGAGTFGLRRVQESACRNQLAVERGALVPYTGRLTHSLPPMVMDRSPPNALARTRQQKHAALSYGTVEPCYSCAPHASADGIDQVANGLNDHSGNGGCVRFTECRFNNKKKPGESTDFYPSRPMFSSSSLQVSFADSSSTPSDSIPADMVTSTSTAGESALLPPAERKRKTKQETGFPTDKLDEMDKKSPKSKKRRSADDKATRKKQKQERKERKKMRCHTKKRNRDESVDSNSLESTNRLKKPSDVDGERHPGGGSPKRPNDLLRSVVSKTSAHSSRNDSVTNGLNEFEQTRTILNNRNHKNRSAFSQMKLPRSALARSVGTAISSFQGKSNVRELTDNRGPSPSTVVTDSKPPFIAAVTTSVVIGHHQPMHGSALEAVAQNLCLRELYQQQPTTKAASFAKAIENGPLRKPTITNDQNMLPISDQSGPVAQRHESARRDILSTHVRGQNQAIGASTLGNEQSLWRTGETAGFPTVESKLVTTLSLPCSESFLEAWSDVVAELASGRWKQHHGDGLTAVENLTGNTPGRGINLVDSPLVNACGVDIEAPGRRGLLVYSVSALEAASDAKGIVVAIATLAAIGRYRSLHIILSYDTEISPSIAKHLTQLQCATIRSNGKPETKVIIKTTSSLTLSSALAQTILGLLAREGERPLKDSILQGMSDTRMQERAQFLLSLLPVLSASGAIETLLQAKKRLPQGSPFFRLLFQNQRLRQQIILAASDETHSTEIHPLAMVQFSNILKL